jgi:branched-chain amino acid transport system permease protein
MAIRAVSQQMDAARLMGIPTRRVFIIVMVISAALAGLAGALLSSVFFLSPSAGFNPMIKSLVVTIFGGLGSVKGTIWAAYVIGLVEAFLQVYMGASWALPGLFLFMIVMLIVRPNGLFGLGEMQRL